MYILFHVALPKPKNFFVFSLSLFSHPLVHFFPHLLIFFSFTFPHPPTHTHARTHTGLSLPPSLFLLHIFFIIATALVDATTVLSKTLPQLSLITFITPQTHLQFLKERKNYGGRSFVRSRGERPSTAGLYHC